MTTTREVTLAEIAALHRQFYNRARQLLCVLAVDLEPDDRRLLEFARDRFLADARQMEKGKPT